MSDTATVFNHCIGARGVRAPADAEPPVSKLMVVGGGTAGWMTALLLSNSAYGPRLQVTVLESPQVGIIGVGEGSTPWLRGFFEELGIEESEWMPACNASALVAALEQGDLGEDAQARFNATVNSQFEGTRDYIVTHFKTNTRSDTDYWRANAANTHLSEPLQRLLRTWLASRPIIGGLIKGTFGRGYPTASWYSLLAGVGLFPDDRESRAPSADEARNDMQAIDNLLERSARNFPDHRELLENIPLQPKERSLQLYLW